MLQQISAKHGQERDGPELQHCHFSLIQAKKCGLYLPSYCVGSSARPQSQKAIGVSLTPSCQLSASLVTFFSVKRMNEPSEKADFQPLTFFLSSCRQTWADHQMLPLFYVYARKNFLMQLLTSFHISIVSLLNKCIPLHYNLSLASHFVFSRTQR